MEKTQHFKVIVSDRARAMLGAHIRFVASISISAARNTRAELSKAIRSVLYQIKDQKVYVDYIVDCRQDYGWLVK